MTVKRDVQSLISTLNRKKAVMMMNLQSSFRSLKEETLQLQKSLQNPKIPQAILALSQTSPENRSARN